MGETTDGDSPVEYEVCRVWLEGGGQKQWRARIGDRVIAEGKRIGVPFFDSAKYYNAQEEEYQKLLSWLMSRRWEPLSTDAGGHVTNMQRVKRP